MTAALMTSLIALQRTTPPEITVWGVLIPTAVFLIAFTVTWLLYRHFRNATGAGGDQSGNAEGP